jgi:ATP-dependent helicase Lhr and Lhr-like helicase
VPLPDRRSGRDVGKADGAASGAGVDGLLRVVEQLAGAGVPASALETLVLPSRVTDYEPPRCSTS